MREIHFRKLLEASGKPKVVTLWAEPKADKTFMSCVKQGRVLTLVQKPTGTQKDFGLIGFHPQPFCSYLVFPKPLIEDADARVVGIKYDLLDHGKIPDATQTESPKKRVPTPVIKKKKFYIVKILRTGSAEFDVEVEAESIAQAKAQAVEEVRESGLSVKADQVSNKVAAVRSAN